MYFFVFDLDHTLLTKNSSVEFCKFLYQKKVFSLKTVFYCLFYYLRHLFFDISLVDLHERLFKKVFHGISLPSLEPYVSEFICLRLNEMIYRPALQELQKAKHLGYRTAILSSSPDFLVQKIAQALGVEECRASKYLVDKEKKFCRIEVMTGACKAFFIGQLDIGKEQVIAYSDSLLDLPFLLAAGDAVVVNPCSKLKKIASRMGWREL